MNPNLLSLAQDALGGDFSKLAAQLIGESPTATQRALTSLLPAVIGCIAQKGSTTQGAASLMSLLNGANLDTSVLGNIGSLFSGGGSGASDLMQTGASSLVPAIFGDRSGGLANALSSSSGMKSSSATNLIAIVVPIVLTFLKKLVGDRELSATSLSSLLASQGPSLQGALVSRITAALGFPSSGAFLDKDIAIDRTRRAGAPLAGSAATVGGAAMSAGGAAMAEARPALARAAPWLIAAAIAFLLWLFLWPKAQAPSPAQTPMSQVPVSLATTPGFAGFPAKVYFDTGSASVGVAGSQTIMAVADAIKSDNARVVVTGYTDRSGDSAQNEELAKTRAMAVRDALRAAGVMEANIEMQPPLFVEAGAGPASAEGRRVEINRM
jgi:outer membrane protein OmpA-like peptidoglycan-associated protein